MSVLRFLFQLLDFFQHTVHLVFDFLYVGFVGESLILSLPGCFVLVFEAVCDTDIHAGLYKYVIGIFALVVFGQDGKRRFNE